MKKSMVLMTAVLCLASLLTGCGSKPELYHAGTYTATAEGYAGDVSVEVDAISSATVTSDAIEAAVKDCMAQAAKPE